MYTWKKNFGIYSSPYTFIYMYVCVLKRFKLKILGNESYDRCWGVKKSDGYSFNNRSCLQTVPAHAFISVQLWRVGETWRRAWTRSFARLLIWCVCVASFLKPQKDEGKLALLPYSSLSMCIYNSVIRIYSHMNLPG